jgi:microcystin-dependent protein
VPSNPTGSSDELATAFADLTARIAALEGAGPFWPGFIAWTASDTAPPGWLIADGSTFDTARYAALSAALGGASTLPNLTGRFPLGADGTHALLSTGGGVTASIAIVNLPSHSHTIGGSTGAGTAHSHASPTGQFITTSGGGTPAAGTNNVTTSLNTASESAHTHPLPANTGSAGSGTALDITNPYLALTPLIHV